MIRIYHGSREIIKEPDYNYHNDVSDLKRGFYCTDDEELAKEWACKRTQEDKGKHFTAYLNVFDFDDTVAEIKDLSLIDPIDLFGTLVLNRPPQHAEDEIKAMYRWFGQEHGIDIDKYDDVDCFISWRCDDRLFNIADYFFHNAIDFIIC